jgi:hypothetical protein
MKKWVVYLSLFGMVGFELFGCGGSGLSDDGGAWRSLGRLYFPLPV